MPDTTPDTGKDKHLPPKSTAPAATPRPNRSKIAEIQHQRRGIKPERRVTDDKSPPDKQVSGDPATLETATRIAAEFIAQEALEKTKLTAEANKAKLELSREQDERRVAAVAADARLAALNRDLADAYDGVAVRQSLSREHTIRVIAGLAATVLISAAVIYRSMTWIPALPAPPIASAAPARAAILRAAPRTDLDTPQIRFAEGLDRLNDTLASVGRKPEDVIRDVRSTFSPAVCPFVWRDGQAALTFRGDMSLTSLPWMFARCADAVATLP